MAKIEFNLENMMKCKCNECPVQAKSECAQKGFKMMPQMMEQMKKVICPTPEKFQECTVHQAPQCAMTLTMIDCVTAPLV